MIYQNDSKPWAVLALVLIVALFIFGWTVANSEWFNPVRTSQEANIRATMASIDVEVTQQYMIPTYDAIHATQETQRQIIAATSVPIQLTATQQAAIAEIDKMKYAATQTAITSDINKRAQYAEARQTEIAKETAREDTEYTISIVERLFIFIIVLIVMSAVVYWIIANGRARERNAQAKVLAEQRRNMELEAAIKNKYNKTNSNSNPLHYPHQPLKPDYNSDRGQKSLPFAN